MGASTQRTSGTSQRHESMDSWIEEVIDSDVEYIEEVWEDPRANLVVGEEIFEEVVEDEEVVHV